MSEAEPSIGATEPTMEENRQCSGCSTVLIGPFEPELSFTKTAAEEEPDQKVIVLARAWICPGCGLAHWYTQGQDLEQLERFARVAEELAPKPGTSYERRMQVLRMLRRVRRI
jgi:uncharacterized protein with PIN domain